MKKFFLALLCGMAWLNLAAQEKVYQVNEISVIDYGDGRLLFRELNGNKTPLEGEYRIIDGQHSEYLLASFKNGMYHGPYRHFKRNEPAEECTYKEGRLEGSRKTYYPDGKTVQNEGTFSDGKMNGVMKSYFPSGKVERETVYKMGEIDGYERRYNEDGELLLDTYYKEGKPEGNWMARISGNMGDYTRRTSYKNGLETGDYSETWSDGNPRKKGSYKEGKKDGVWIQYRKGGIPEISVTYKDGEKTGEEIRYFTNGQPETVRNFLNGKREGISREYYYSNGNLKSEFTYKANREEGPYKRFYEDGTLREEGRCENDTQVYRKEYYDNGRLKSVAERRNGSWITTERYGYDGNKL